jgi:DNA-binding XRE family transcriptional regulator
MWYNEGMRQREFRDLYHSHPQLFEQMLGLREQGYTIRDIADWIWDEYSVRITNQTIAQYLWRYRRLQEQTGNFWNAERIRRFPEEFSRCLHIYVYARSLAHLDDALAKRLIENVTREMCERVLAQERGETLPPLGRRGTRYMDYTTVESTVLRNLRLQRKLSVEELARRAGVQNYTLSKWERYGVLPNSLDTIDRIAQALGVPITTLLEDYHSYRRLDRANRKGLALAQAEAVKS